VIIIFNAVDLQAGKKRLMVTGYNCVNNNVSIIHLILEIISYKNVFLKILRMILFYDF